MTTDDSSRKTSSRTEKVFAIQYQGPPGTLELLADLLSGQDLAPSIWHRREDPTATLSLYVDEATEAATLKQQLDRQSAEWKHFLPEPVTALPVIRIPRENWAESWKRFFHTRQVSPRIIIKPTWESCEVAEDQIVVEIDPGMSFGTGQHATTIACLQLLEAVITPGNRLSLADAGCGSGILSIAAAKLGFAPIEAFDYDPVAVAVATANCCQNQVGTLVSPSHRDVATWQPPAPFDVVVANILAPVLIQHAETIAKAVAGHGQLILSGILTEQFAEVNTAYAGQGFSFDEERTIEEWTSGRFRRV